MNLHAKYVPPTAIPTPTPVPAPRPQPAGVTAAAMERIDDNVSAAARNLAMAHYLARLIDRGEITDYTHVARLLGVSQPRATHLMSLTLLAPAIQAAILSGTVAPGDKTLRRLARIADWQEQEQVLAG